MVNRYNSKLNMSRGSSIGCGCNGTGRIAQRQSTEPDCGCEISGECKKLMQKLQKIDFSIVDTVLYLDMYPECTKALAYYNKLMCERDEIRKALAEKCNRPMTSFENSSDTSWDYISSPWPWDISAN